jgi:hypothetical protein
MRVAIHERASFTVDYGTIHVEITASAEDIAWLRPLFARNAKPFSALHALGYTPADNAGEPETSR